MKILIVLPYDNTYRYRAAFVPALSYQPLTLSYLAALVPHELNAQITLIDEGVQNVDYSLSHYELVCISIVTSSSPRGYELAQFFRERGSYVVIGGHHASLLPDEAMQYADTVLTGNAEQTFPQFCRDYYQGTPNPRYDSLGFCTTRLPIPRRDLMPRRGYLKQPTVIADFGCPNQCKFCVIHSFWGKQTRRPVAEVIDEIRSLGVKEILLLDPSPFADQQYALEFLEALATLRIQWAGLCTTAVANDMQMLDKLQKSGCIGMLMGFETFAQADLDSLDKHNNKVIAYSRQVHNLHQYQIAVLGTFMLGLDSDTAESLTALPELIAQTKIDIPRFAIMTPWPNTPLFRELAAAGRILHQDWSRYDSVHCVFQPQNMSANELEQHFLKVWQKCYTPHQIYKRLKHTPQRKLTALVTNTGFHIYAKRVRKLLSET